MNFRVAPSTIRDATVTVPGDKSISHRALMLGSLAKGRTTISGFLASEDCLATLQVFRDLGVNVEQLSETELIVEGVGIDGLTQPSKKLDFGNSGTGMRLMAGLLAGQEFRSELTGDASLRGRPMQRIVTPLQKMGAKVETDDGRPPLIISGCRNLHAIDYDLPVASAQVKSAVLFAGLYADGSTSVIEPAITRDHTERMLRAFGATVSNMSGKITVLGRPMLSACDIQVPGDLSSATFVMLAAILAKRADVLIRSVGVNPTRAGVIEILRTMGANIQVENPRVFGDEPVADIRVGSSVLNGIDVDPSLVSLAIDEFPALFVAAAAAQGKTSFANIGELRVKESDRIGAMVTGLRQLGVTVDESSDGAVVTGGQIQGGEVQSFGDHRVAMSFAVAGTIAADTVTVVDTMSVDTSFPGFAARMQDIGADVCVMAEQGE